MIYMGRKVNVKRKDGRTEEIYVYDPQEFPIDEVSDSYMTSSSNASHGGRKKVAYELDFCTFDIETTTLDNGGPEEGKPWAFMWHWQACICGRCVFGRRWEEFFDFFKRLSEHLRLKQDKRMVVFVHNLGFEWAFMYPMVREHFGEYHIFATGSHEPVKISFDNGLEFRCSYKLSNMSLWRFTQTEMACPYEKAYGDLDYKKVRTAGTPITDEEAAYNLIDVLGLYHAVKSKMAGDKDIITTLPITSTGYPRRITRRACREDESYHDKVFVPLALKWEVYKMLKESGRGGNTHGSRFLAGRIIYDIFSMDYVSEYPSEIVLQPYPMTPWCRYGEVESLDELHELMDQKACLFRVTFFNLDILPDQPVPYLPIDKATHIIGGIEGDNGRVLRAPGAISYTLTDIDFKIVEQIYDISGGVAISDMYISDYKPLPEPIRETVLKFFRLKCEIKRQIKEAKEDHKRGIYTDEQYVEVVNLLKYKYGKVKNLLNSIFGMMYTDPVKEEMLMDDDGSWHIKETEEDPEELGKKLLNKFNNSRNSFLNYTWGVWTTAWGRWSLHQLQACAVHRDGDRVTSALVYSDTDSAKAYAWDYEALAELNARIIQKAEELGAYAEAPDGTKDYLGWAEEDSHARRFITWGAKKYAYEDDAGLHVTVSGVANVTRPGEYLGLGALELQAHGGLEAFRPGFIWKEAGGMEVWYGHSEPRYVTVDGCRMLTASYAALKDGFYTLGLTEEYQALIGYV